MACNNKMMIKFIYGMIIIINFGYYAVFNEKLLLYFSLDKLVKNNFIEYKELFKASRITNNKILFVYKKLNIQYLFNKIGFFVLIYKSISKL